MRDVSSAITSELADRGIPQGVEKWWYMCGIMRMQTRDNLERMVVIKAFIAYGCWACGRKVSVKKHKMTAVENTDADRVETAVG